MANNTKHHAYNVNESDVWSAWKSSVERMKSVWKRGTPAEGEAQYELYKESVFSELIFDEDGKPDPEQLALFKKLDDLVEKNKNYKNTDHYVYGFISNVAAMTHCFKRTNGNAITTLIALWLVPVRIKACHNEYMTDDRIEYVLNLAKKEGIPLKHF